MTAVLVFAGAVVGAPLRYLTDRLLRARHGDAFPWGTLTVNVVGSLVLGALAGAGTAVPQPVFALAGTGFCGALTTYSTFSHDTLRLTERGAWPAAVVHVAVTVVAGVGAAVVASAVVRGLLG